MKEFSPKIPYHGLVGPTLDISRFSVALVGELLEISLQLNCSGGFHATNQLASRMHSIQGILTPDMLAIQCQSKVLDSFQERRSGNFPNGKA